ncbi:MAG: IspD/TarI family cytidylyltransferase [Dehalococcoidia bacterium]|nr:IspD/TarI family cytidylyltransferase [Dehalococcoidia bacterium]
MKSSKSLIAIILGAGQSKRMQGIDKILHEFQNQPLILYSVKQFLSIKKIKKIVIVTNKVNFQTINDIVNKNINNKLLKNIKIIEGGLRRQDSVKNALNCLPEADQYLIHDGARPFVSKKLIENIINSLCKYDAVVPIINISDSLKKIKSGEIIENLDKDTHALAQTPQGFSGESIRNAFYNHNDKNYSDCSSMVFAAGYKIHTIQGESKNIKITTQDDLSKNTKLG